MTLSWGSWERQGWSVVGDRALPASDPEAPEDWDGLDEDLWMAVGPGGHSVDVGWYPDGDPAGSYWCRLVRPGGPEEWEHPMDELRTRSTAEMRTWIDTACARAEAEQPTS